MKRFTHLLIALLSTLCCATAQTPHNYDLHPQTRMGNHFPVKGGVGVESFYLALAQGLSEYYAINNFNSVDEDPEGSYTVDKKNGYLRHVVEGAGKLETQCCYWKRNNGRCLVGFYYDNHDMDANGGISCTSFLQFYTYNETLRTLEPIRNPWDEEIEGVGHLIAELPCKGKDLRYRWGNEEDDTPWSTLSWNGYDFRKKPAPATTIREGKHLLSLQWIEGVKYGSCQIKATGKPGEYLITGTHYNKTKTDWLKIEGKLNVVNAKRLCFNGTIKSRVNYIAGGKEQIRCGTYDFVATGNRKYWRLEQMHNPGEICVDYVDIYFN
ncbi:MAG: hypothetical protein KBT12_03515 [Bacteroidales bacterium]|nr:hypothetical protein [Candidatus Physcousia equi]